MNCMRVASEKECGNGGWLHKRLGAATTFLPPKEKRVTDTELHIRFAPLTRRWYVNQGERVTTLAAELGVAAWALDLLHVGWDGTAWTMPEQNHAGLTVGINRRFEDGKKCCMVGSRRGLTYADDWSEAEGPVFIVEGASDVAAGLTLGLCMVGRPSNTGGVEYLWKLLQKQNRRMVILAERDQKENPAHDPACKCCGQCFPGKFGAIQTSIRLSKKLERIVEWRFLPGKAKDLRVWLNEAGPDLENEKALWRLRMSLLRYVQRRAK